MSDHEAEDDLFASSESEQEEVNNQAVQSEDRSSGEQVGTEVNETQVKQEDVGVPPHAQDVSDAIASPSASSESPSTEGNKLRVSHSALFGMNDDDDDEGDFSPAHIPSEGLGESAIDEPKKVKEKKEKKKDKEREKEKVKEKKKKKHRFDEDLDEERRDDEIGSDLGEFDPLSELGQRRVMARGDPRAAQVPSVERFEPDTVVALVSLPNIAAVEPKEFDPATYDPKVCSYSQARNDRTLATGQVVRWRRVTDESGVTKIESNAKVIRWPDGLIQVKIGSDVYNLSLRPTPADSSELAFVDGADSLNPALCAVTHRAQLVPSDISRSTARLALKRAIDKETQRKTVEETKHFVDLSEHRGSIFKQHRDMVRSSSSAGGKRGGVGGSGRKRGKIEIDDYDRERYGGRDDDSDDEGYGSIMASDERLSRAKTGHGAVKAGKKRSRRDVDEEDEEAEDLDVDDEEEEEEEEEGFDLKDSDDESDNGSRRKDKSKKGKGRLESDDDDDDDDDANDDDGEAARSTKRRRIAADDDDDEE